MMERQVVLPDVWSRRKRNAEKSGEDVWSYDDVPTKLRVQVLRIVMAATGLAQRYDMTKEILLLVNEDLKDELGLHQLATGGDAIGEFSTWLERHADIDGFLDALEFWVNWCHELAKEHNDYKLTDAVPRAIEAINARFKEAGVGYRLVDGKVTKIADEFLHQQATLPVLAILGRKGYENAQSELRKAFEEYKSGSYEDCLTDCCKALESVLKVIGKARKWGISDTDSLSRLLDAAFANGLIARDLQAQFNGLRSVLGATGTVRNKHAAHGAGTSHRNIPEHIATYQLHLTASAILFLHHSANMAATVP